MAIIGREWKGNNGRSKSKGNEKTRIMAPPCIKQYWIESEQWWRHIAKIKEKEKWNMACVMCKGRTNLK